MKSFIQKVTRIYPSSNSFHLVMLFFRVIVSVQLIVVHGLKKIGVGVAEAELIPNPLHLPEKINQYFAISSNLVFPILIILGLLTRLAILPVLAVTLTGYFIVHWSDPLLAKDIPFMYSLIFLLLFFLGPGKYSIDYFINKK
jgi:putative oxidoreductase